MYHFNFKVSMYEKRSNQLHICLQVFPHLPTTHFLCTLKLVRLNLNIFPFKKKNSKNQFHLIYGSDKRVYKNCQLI